MSALARFGVAFRSLESTALGVGELLPSRLSTAAADALDGVDAAGLSLFADDLRVPIGSSDAAAALAQQLQFTVGDGPCIAAHRSQCAVAANQAALIEQWPRFARGLLSRTPYQAVLSLPLPDGMTRLGTLDLYFHRDVRPAEMPTGDAMLISSLVSASLVRAHFNITHAEDDTPKPNWLDNPSAARRFLVPVASGMLLAHTGRGFPDALALLRSRAIAGESTVDAVAADIVGGALPVDALIHQ